MKTLIALLVLVSVATAALIEWETTSDIDSPSMFYVETSPNIPGNWSTLTNLPVDANVIGFNTWSMTIPGPSPLTNTFYRVGISNWHTSGEIFWSDSTNVPRLFNGTMRVKSPKK